MDEIAQELIRLQNKYAQLALNNWYTSSLFTLNWWILVFSFIIPWIIFFIVLDRKRSLQIWCFGLTVIIITSFADDLGGEIGAWIYPIKFVPFGLLAFPFDFCIIPVTFMLLYQYLIKWKSYIIALFITASIFSFIGEPISVLLGFVTYLKWRYLCSFVFYIITGIGSRLFIDKISQN
ncbi:hypothetical protein SAMN05877753_102669 [Bacillus oleivorans]|uniref:Uncharacterized protein n=2 Tax=Bacillus oleivorans TaxID=1448271 RepID=A0A285CNY3_9BACI|nr:hypothetical protein SAMN05877753_102669 [Bacillus oleivorans]